MSDTLVLDRNYMPINQIGWEDAMTLVCLEKVEVVAEYADRFVRTVRKTFKLPSVIRFLTEAVGRRKAVRYSKENVYARDRGKCQYCGKKVSLKLSTLDHVTPRAQGGITRWENIVTSCWPCNQAKRDRTPHQAGMRLSQEPVRPGHLPETLRISLANGAVPSDWEMYLLGR